MPIYIFHQSSGGVPIQCPSDESAIKAASGNTSYFKIEFAPTGRIVWERAKPPLPDPQYEHYGTPFKFAVGQSVFKPNGYSFEGEVRAAFTTKKGEIRYVVELTGGGNGNGMLHIFAEGQLEPAS